MKAGIEVPVGALKVAGRLRQEYWRRFRPFTYGASVMVVDECESEALMVRPNYGDTHVWSFPGGGVPRGQLNAAKGNDDDMVYRNTAFRELSEEVGICVQESVITAASLLVAAYHDAGANRDTHRTYLYPVNSKPKVVLSNEVAEAAWHPLDAIPDTTYFVVLPSLESYRMMLRNGIPGR